MEAEALLAAGVVDAPNQPVWLIAATSPVRAVTVAVTVVMMPGSVYHQLLGFPSSLMDFSTADWRHQTTPLHGAMRAWRLSSGIPWNLIQQRPSREGI